MPLPEAHLKSATRRQPKTGQTRFHEGLSKAYAFEVTPWLDSGVAPWNRPAKDGTWPLVSALKALTQALTDQAKVARHEPMPAWWPTVHRGEATQEAYEAAEGPRCAKNVAVFERAWSEGLAATDWSLWSPQAWGSLAQAVAWSAPKDGQSQIQALIAAGFPASVIDRGVRFTPAMWAALYDPWAPFTASWLALEPIDPPGAGPGLLSVLIYDWTAGASSVRLALLKATDQAGGSWLRPVFPEAADGRREDPDRYARRSPRSQPVDRPQQATLLGQATGWDDVGLNEHLAEHAPPARALPPLVRYETVLGQVKALGSCFDPDQSKIKLKALDAVLAQEPCDPIWSSPSAQPLAEAARGALWSRSWLEPERALVLQVVERLTLLGVAWHGREPFDRLVSKVEHLVSRVSVEEGIDRLWNDPMGVMRQAPPGQSLEVHHELVRALTRAWLHGRHRTTAWRLLDDALKRLPAWTFKDACTGLQGLSKEVFATPSKNGVHPSELGLALARFEQVGWRPEPEDWARLHRRTCTVTYKDVHDHPRVIEALAQVLVRHATPVPNTEGLIWCLVDDNGAFASAPDPTRSAGYGHWAEWTPAVQQQAHETWLALALAQGPINEPLGSPSMSWLERAARASTKRPNDQALQARVESLLALGADPSAEPFPDDRAPWWTQPGLEPFARLQAQRQAEALAATATAPQAVAPRPRL